MSSLNFHYTTLQITGGNHCELQISPDNGVDAEERNGFKGIKKWKLKKKTKTKKGLLKQLL
jgi:hypothetical protein